MEYEWDEVKNRSNLLKHGISFEDATAVFGDRHRLNETAHEIGGEARVQTIGRAAATTVLLVVHAKRFRDGNTVVTRIISARPASRKERQRYFDQS